MGKASRIDLPEPLEASPAAAGGTDDLLSQLAGDEIDRLLAASDVEREPAAVEPPPPAVSASADVQPSASSPVPAPISPPSARQAQPAGVMGNASAPRIPPSAAAPTSKPAADDANVAADLDAVFEQQTKGVYPPAVGAKRPAASPPPADDFAGAIAVAATAARSAPPLGAKAVVVGNVSAPVFAADTEVDTAGAAPVIHPAPHAAEGVSEADASVAASERAALDLSGPAPSLPYAIPGAGPAPWYVRLPHWLAAPLAALPDALHDAAGKIAILTFVNAVAILAYLVIFRRH